MHAMTSKTEYREGSQVAEEFEDAMKRVFQTPKPQREDKQPTTASERRTEGPDKD
jgi:hypothetical protein